MSQSDKILFRGLITVAGITLTFVALMAAISMPKLQAAERTMRNAAWADHALREIYGPLPVALIRDFQDKAGLVVTGEIDDATKRELGQALVWKRHGGPAPLPKR